MLRDVRHLAHLRLASLCLSGALVSIAMTSAVADEQFAPTSIVQLPDAQILSSFDISFVERGTHTYALAASRVTGSGGNFGTVIIVNTGLNLVTKELQANPPFAGACSFPGRNTISGPNGVIVIEKGSNTDIWAGDGPVPKASSITKLCVSVSPPNPTPADIDKPSSVKVLDLKTGKTKATIYTGGIGRADELCYNPISDVVLVANDETFDNFITFIGEDSYKVLQRITFDGTDTNGNKILANGIEQCQFNPRDGKFYLSLPDIGGGTNGVGGSTGHDGAVVRISGHAPFKVEAVFPIAASTGCLGPQGLAVGPEHQLALGCGGTNSLIIDDRDGSTIKVVTGQGGTDEAWYNPGSKHYFFARSGTAATGGFLGVEDAGPPPSADATAASGFGSHSVAADPIKNQVYVPIRGNSGVTGSANKICSSAKDVFGITGSDVFGCIAVYTSKPRFAP